MKRQVLTLAAICSISSLIAQHATIAFSTRTNCDDKATHELFSFGDGSAKYLCFEQDKMDNMKVASYDKTFKKTEKTIKVGAWGDGDIYNNGPVMTRNHAYHFAAAMPKKKDCVLSCLPITPSFGTADVTPQKVVTVPSIMGPHEYSTRGRQGGFWNFAVSADSTKILGKCELLNTDRGPDAGVSIYVWSEDLKLLWNKDFVLPRKRLRLEDVKYFLSNDGSDAYMLYKFWDDYNHPESKPGYHYELAKFSKGASAPVVASLDFKSLFYSDVTAAMDPEGTLVVAAIGQESYDDNTAAGCVLLKMSAGGKIEPYHKGIYNLSHEELAKLAKMKADRKQSGVDANSKYEQRSPSLRLIGMNFDTDGSLQAYVTPEYFSMGAMPDAHGYPSGNRFADHIYTFYISTSGSLTKTAKTPRLSSSWGALTTTGPDGSVYFYVYENPANATRDLTKDEPLYVDYKKFENNGYDLIRLKPDGTSQRVKLLPYDIIPADKGKFRYSLSALRFISADECIGTFTDYKIGQSSNEDGSSVFFRAKLSW